jgi:hypothetical protein
MATSFLYRRNHLGCRHGHLRTAEGGKDQSAQLALSKELDALLGALGGYQRRIMARVQYLQAGIDVAETVLGPSQLLFQVGDLAGNLAPLRAEG